jgi:hypothetical protein
MKSIIIKGSIPDFQVIDIISLTGWPGNNDKKNPKR